MASALQIPSWPNPYAADNYTDAYATVFALSIDAVSNSYSISVKVFANFTAFQAGKLPIAEITYRNQDGMFPSFLDALGDPEFGTPLLQLRDWILLKTKAGDPRFTDATII